jgi:hypothetical protein
MEPLEGKMANTPRLDPVSTKRQRIAKLARQAPEMAFNIQGFFDVLDHGHLRSFLDQRVRDVCVAKPSIEEPDAIELARPDLWGAGVGNDPGLPDRR